jgi:lipoprotein-anchoring transpeptidase ErfK/SrfK
MRRAVLVVLATLAVSTGSLSAAPGTSGRVLTSTPAAPPAHVDAQAKPELRPLRFLLVDAAGATVRAWPGGTAIGTMSQTTPLGAHSWAWAISTTPRGRWGRIVLPWRPNGRTGWIDLRGRSLVRTATWVRADLSKRSVTLLRGRRAVATFPAAIGAPSSPTPTGRFSVTDLVPTGDPSGPFGWYAFGLSGHQPNLPAGWGGGDQLAIHGTNTPSSIGTAASAGCLRVSAGALSVLKAQLRLATPVVIQR